MTNACSIRVRGIVQGVGFRPFVYRLARAHALRGWVLNGEQGVEIHVEGDEAALRAFVVAVKSEAPPAAQVVSVEANPAEVAGFRDFLIRGSEHRDRPTVRISPDLPVCDECLCEMFHPADRRYHYPYINCTNCGPRYTVILGLPYDRPQTTMKAWALDEYCGHEYEDPGNRRFHAQPVACSACGPQFRLQIGDATPLEDQQQVMRRAVDLLQQGKILAVKGLGGYHLACDARNLAAVRAMRERKYRKDKPFAIMASTLAVARSLVNLSPEAEILLACTARPIVLAPAKAHVPEIAPDNHELGVMLPYTPLQHLLFAFGAPEVLVMTSANRSSEPIAYDDADALECLGGIADAFLIGERPIARRVDDSVARAGAFGPAILRRARGYAPGAVATVPAQRPILALGADLKNTVTLVVGGEALVSQHIGDLEHQQAFRAFEETIRDLVAMYEVRWDELLVVHDAHPQYASTAHALTFPVTDRKEVQHHRAHVASVIAEHGDWEKRVLGVSFDGTGYGDDGSIWGGEFFAGSVREGFDRVAHLRPAALPGGDAAARHPVQAAAGFLFQIDDLPDLSAEPFRFPSRYAKALQLVHKNVRTFNATSMGRLFDAAAALLGFTREISFEGQAAMWLEHLARGAPRENAYPFPFADGELDFRPLLHAVAQDRIAGTSAERIARAFQLGVASGVCHGITALTRSLEVDTVVFSGGVFQNELLLQDLKTLLPPYLQVWTNHAVPANDGGISLGQAALVALAVEGDARESEKTPATMSDLRNLCTNSPLR